MPIPQRRDAFTLIEMSVVLVIIALIVGGLVTATSLIEQGRYRSLMSEIDRIKNAATTFQTKYGELPGDFTQAESLWGSDASCPLTPANTTPKTATCNGNGTGKVGDANGGNVLQKPFRFWQQLADAGLWKGQFTGVPSSGLTTDLYAVVGTNIPPVSMSPDMGYFVSFYYAAAAGNWFFGGNYGNYIAVGEPYLESCSFCYYAYPFLTAPQAFAIDSKYDDGKPATGSIMVNYAVGARGNPVAWRPCYTGALDATATYNVADTTDVYCNLLFTHAF
jgi:prepilin-type N-terminal cleavage/methylation domain-containing protein